MSKALISHDLTARGARASEKRWASQPDHFYGSSPATCVTSKSIRPNTSMTAVWYKRCTRVGVHRADQFSKVNYEHQQTQHLIALQCCNSKFLSTSPRNTDKNLELQHCSAINWEWIRFGKCVWFADLCVDSGLPKERGDSRGGGIFPVVPFPCEHGTNLIKSKFNSASKILV